MKFLSKVLLILIPITALTNIVTETDAQGTRCWRTAEGWVCQQQQQTNPSDGR